MSSFTIAYELPYTQEAQDIINRDNQFLNQTNSFLVPQNFAGIVNSGNDSCVSLNVSDNASVIGLLNAGATTVASLNIIGDGNASAFTANSLTVTNASVFNGQISGTSAVFSGALSGANGLTINSGTVSFPVQSQSGASVINNTLPALSIVNNSISDAQILDAGISQSSILNGYVDMTTNQTVGGEKTFGYSRFAAGLWAIGTTTLQDTTTTNLSANRLVVGGPVIANGLNSRVTCDGPVTSNTSMTAPTFNGALVGNASTCSIASNVIVRTDNAVGSFAIPFIKTSDGNDSIYVDDATTPFMTYSPSDGLLSTAGITITGASRLNNVVLPVAQT